MRQSSNMVQRSISPTSTPKLSLSVGSDRVELRMVRPSPMVLIASGAALMTLGTLAYLSQQR